MSNIKIPLSDVLRQDRVIKEKIAEALGRVLDRGIFVLGKELEEFENEGITCPICGGPARRIGNCSILCESCKTTTRNGCGE